MTIASEACEQERFCGAMVMVGTRGISAQRRGPPLVRGQASQCRYTICARGAPHVETGHSLMKAKLKEESAVLAGEMSGHMFFADRYFGFDDAIYASCRLVEILAKTKQSLSSLVADLPQTTVTPEIRVDCPDAVKFKLVDQVRRHYRLFGSRKRSAPDSGLRDW